MNPFNYYLTVLKKYIVFKGRSRRSEFWYFVLFNQIIASVVGYIGGLINVPILGLIYFLAVLIPMIAVSVRRMHAVGKSGWFVLIPIYNLILAVTEGEKGSNAYGPSPK